AGAWSTYVCCRPELTLQNLDKVRQIYEEFNKNGPSAEEFERARTKVGSRVVLGSERPMGRLTSLGGNWLSGQGYRSVEDDLETLAKLSLKDVHELLAEFPLAQSTSMGYGPFEGK
ncbi:MAG: insulinase family protein, partial [Planctomycetaceae bacterium]|nr:insulinase family protein [Planctomycetaceae bacterium]